MQKVKLNIVPKGVKKAAYLSQNDNGRVVRYELFNELVPYTLDGSETITVKVVRPDGEEILENIENTFEGKAYIDVSFNDDMSAITGVGAGEIKITDGETELGSHNFDINVEIDAYNGKDVVIETETGTLLSFNTEVEDNALEYESEIPYNAEGYTGLEIINSRTAPAYNKTPYLFRKTPDNFGNSCKEKIIGASVAFNQLVQNGNFADGTTKWETDSVSISVSSGVLSITNTGNNGANCKQRNLPFVSGHKYLVSADISSSDLTSCNTMIYDGVSSIYLTNSNLTSTFKHYDGIVVATNTGTNGQLQLFRTTSAISGTVNYKNVNMFDLTQMLGSTLADYIYNLEQATSGAGVSLFKSLGFNKPYYDYNAGSLLSSKPVSKKVVGFNQWDEEIRNGYYSNDGIFHALESSIANKNPIPVLPDTEYYCYSASTYIIIIFTYDKNFNFINRITGAKNSTFTTPSNCYYIAFCNAYGEGGAYGNDICINISDADKNGTYEPYSATTYDFTGERKVWRRYRNYTIDNTTTIINQTTLSNVVRYTFVTLNEEQVISGGSCLSDRLINDNSYSGDYPHFYIDNTAANKGRVYVFLPIGESIGTINMIYELATPYEEIVTDPELRGVFKLDSDNNIYADGDIFTDFDNPQEVKVTEEFIDERSIPIPVGHDTIYGTDIEILDIDFDTTIYGGNINAIDGVLSSEYNSDGSVKPTPEIIDITPTPIPVRAGDNVIFNSAEGNQTIRYYNQVE